MAYLSRQMYSIIGCSLLISKRNPIIFTCECAGNYHGLKTSEFYYILELK